MKFSLSSLGTCSLLTRALAFTLSLAPAGGLWSLEILWGHSPSILWGNSPCKLVTYGESAPAFDGRIFELCYRDSETLHLYDEERVLSYAPAERRQGVGLQPVGKQHLSRAFLAADSEVFAYLESSILHVTRFGTNEILSSFGNQEDQVRHAILSQGGGFLAYVSTTGVHLVDLNTGSETWSSAIMQGRPDGLGIAPDGSSVVVHWMDEKNREGNLLHYDTTGAREPVSLGSCGTWGSRHFVFNGDGSLILGARDLGSSTELTLWNSETGEVVRTARGGFNQAVFSPDGSRYAAGGLNRIQVWETATGKLITDHRDCEGVNEHVYGLAFSPDGQTLAAGIEDRLKFFQVDPWLPLLSDQGHRARVLSLAHSPGSDILYTGDLCGRVIAWDTNEKTIRWQIETWPAGWGASALQLSPDGSLLAVTSPPRTRNLGARFRVINAATGELVSLCEDAGSFGNNLVFSADNTQVYSAGPAGVVLAWEVATGKALGIVSERDGEGESGQNSTVLDWIPDSLQAQVEGSWLAGNPELGLRKIEGRWALLPTIGYWSGSRLDIALSPEGDALLCGGECWLPLHGKLENRGEKGALRRAAVFPQGRLVATRMNRPGKSEIELFDLITRQILCKGNLRGGEIESLAFSPDGRKLVAVGTMGIREVELASIFSRKALENRPTSELWTAMASSNLLLAYQATWALAARSDAVTFLAKNLLPAKPLTAGEEARLRSLLDDPERKPASWPRESSSTPIAISVRRSGIG